MGWFFPNGATRKGLIQELTRTEENEKAKSVCLASCFRGAITHQGVLWSVREVTHKGTGDIYRFISCDLIKVERDQWGDRSWGYKSMEEAVHPYYYSCPMKYLKMVPVVTCKEWRDKVIRLYEEKRKK